MNVTVYKHPKSPFWYARATAPGVDRRWSTKVPIGIGVDRPKSHKRALAAARAQLEQQGAPAPRASDESLERVAVRMLAQKRVDGRRPRALESIDWNLDHFVYPHFGRAREVSTIRRQDLEQFKAHLLGRGMAPTTINNALAAVRGVLKHAWAVEELLDAIPQVANMRVDSAGKGRALEAGELGDFLGKVDALEPQHFLQFLVNTGVRRAEALAVRFSWIDWERRLLNIPAAFNKGGRERPAIILNEAALEVLRARQALHAQRRNPKDDRVFRRNRLDDSRRAAAKAAGLGRVRNHDLRVTRASQLVEAGATLPEVRDDLGHSTLTMVNRYQKTQIERRRVNADKVQMRAPGPPAAPAPGAK